MTTMTEAQAKEIADLLTLRAELKDWLETIGLSPEVTHWTIDLTGHLPNKRQQTYDLSERQIPTALMKKILQGADASAVADLIERGVTPEGPHQEGKKD